MNKNRLILVMDVALVAALALIISNLDYPYYQTFADYWEEERAEYLRSAVSMLWLISLWLGLYRPFDGADRVTPPVALLGAGRALCALTTSWATRLVIYHPIALLSQQIYGGLLMVSVVVDYLLLLFLGRANADAPDCAAASRRWRGVLLGALVILAAGIGLAAVWNRRAVWMSAAVAGAYLLAFSMTSRAGAGKEE